MAEATWGDASSPDIDWRMSAALENVPRGDADLAEVTSLAGAIAEWRALDEVHRDAAILTPERPLLLDGVTMTELRGSAIGALADRLGDRPAENDDTIVAD